MNQVVIRQEQPKQKMMLLEYMADKYSLKPEQFRDTVRATCGLAQATPEQVAAFLIVAKEYDLNPLLKEIYAFPGRGGGVVPIVSIDGWVNLVNSHPQCDGFDFATENDEKGELYSITCTMHRKDRKHPTVVTEYLSECVRPTEPWKMKHRMLRHKAFIQGARYAYGFAGIYDEDEGRTIADAVDVTPKTLLKVPSPSEVEQEMIPPAAAVGEVMTGVSDPISSGPQPSRWLIPNIVNEYDGWFTKALDTIVHATDGGELESFWNAEIDKHRGTDAIFPSDLDDLTDAYTKQQQKLSADE